MRIDLIKSSIMRTQDPGLVYSIKAFVEADNGDEGNLPLDYRRWWHFRIDNLPNDPSNIQLLFEIHQAEYNDIILPVWSFDGQTYERCPTSATPIYWNSVHYFNISIPSFTPVVYFAKYFPYPLSKYGRFRSEVLAHPNASELLSERIFGDSGLGYPLQVWEIAKEETQNRIGAPRLMIQAGIHPAEDTSYFITEGLVTWLLSGNSEAEKLLEIAVIDIIPMCNPDGVALGNYRTNAKNVNLEIQYADPYQSEVEETKVIIGLVEEYMGTNEDIGEHPIMVLLNLHSTHGVDYPFHFVHEPRYHEDGTGVIPQVHQLEQLWVSLLNARSQFIRFGKSQSSTLSGRYYIESMMHDRWSIDPNYSAPITMAITLEGTYQLGPDTRCCNQKDDYRLLGEEIGLALMDFVSLN